MKVMKRNERQPPTPERLTWAKDTITISTAGYTTGGLRPDWTRLSDDEQGELVGLVGEASDGGGFNPTRLGKRRERYETLVEKGCGKPAGSVFEAARALAELRSLGAEFQRERRSPPRRVALEEAGSVTLPRQVVYDFVRDGILWPSHIALLTYLITTFENGGLPRPSAAVSYDGDAVTLDMRLARGLLPDPDGVFINEGRLLDHLADNQFLVITKVGSVWTIRPGSRLRRTRRAA